MTIRMENAKLFRVIAMGVSMIAATGHGAQASEIVIDGGWFRALPPAVPSGAYFTLRNGGAQTVTLVGADSPACGMLMLHKSENHGGMGSMMDMETVDIAAGGAVSLHPGRLSPDVHGPQAGVEAGHIRAGDTVFQGRKGSDGEFSGTQRRRKIRFPHHRRAFL